MRVCVVLSETLKIMAAFESKIWSGFGANQLEKYRRRLQSMKRTDGLLRCYLVTITASGEKPDGADKHFRWSQVHTALNRAAGEGRNRFLQGVCKQFASFLEEKGLAPMKR